MPMPRLNQFQVTACQVYGGGDYAHIADSLTPNDDASDVGDTLFTFIMRELANDAPSCPMDRDTAVQRMETAIRDLQGVINAL